MPVKPKVKQEMHGWYFSISHQNTVVIINLTLESNLYISGRYQIHLHGASSNLLRGTIVLRTVDKDTTCLNYSAK